MAAPSLQFFWLQKWTVGILTFTRKKDDTSPLRRGFGITDWSASSLDSRFPGFASSEPPKLNRRFANRQRLPTSCSCHCPFICIFILILSGFPIYLCITLPIYCLQSSTGGSLTAIDYLVGSTYLLLPLFSIYLSIYSYLILFAHLFIYSSLSSLA